MRAVVKNTAAPGLQVVTDWPEPVAGPGQVLIEVAAASLCGTDRELVEWTPSAQAFGASAPFVLGHEGSGTVLEVGEGVQRLAPGDRVALESHVVCGRCSPCRTGSAHVCERTQIVGINMDGVFAERVSVPADVCVPLPDAIDLETGALLEAAGVAVHAVQRSGGAVAGQNVLVNGCGPVGLVAARVSMALGAAHVVAVEPNAFRRAQAEALGVQVLHPSEDVAAICHDIAGARGGFDVAFEVSGVRGVLPTLLAALRPEADLVTIGHPSEPAPIDIARYVNKRGITVRGIFGRRLWNTWEQLLLLLDSGRLDLDWLITHRFALEQAEEAVELLTGEAGKVLLLPGQR